MMSRVRLLCGLVTGARRLSQHRLLHAASGWPASSCRTPVLVAGLVTAQTSEYEECGRVDQPPPAAFAIDSAGASLVAPWIVALGVKADYDKDDFAEFNVKCSGSFLTQD